MIVRGIIESNNFIDEIQKVLGAVVEAVHGILDVITGLGGEGALLSNLS